MLIWLCEEDAPRTPEDYDKFISAEIPDEKAEPVLFAQVKSFMVHGPCGILNPKSPCMFNKAGEKKSYCQKDFPKEFCEHTTQENENKKPLYRRRRPQKELNTMKIFCNDTGKHIKIDNRWIVPYNRFLLQKYATHINLEILCSVCGIKYVTKYLCKGCDK